jgi:16S rRNA (guanine527-N7)-methyltransferase
MPPLDAAALQAGAAALSLTITSPQADQLLAYLDLLARWNRVYNLTAVRDAAQMGTHHLLDSLSIVPPLERHAAGRPLAILDVGSGGGLPGVVLAIAHPEWQVTCVDAVAKKAGFVQQVALELGLRNLHSAHARVEKLAPASVDIVISRAFASLPDFTTWTQHHLAPHGVWLAMKGKHPTDEIAALPQGTQVFHVEQLQVPGLDADRCAIWLRPVARDPQ